MKVTTAIIGFLLIVVGITSLAGIAPPFGIHPVVWFILGAGLLLSDSAWEKLARKREDAADQETDDDDNGGSSNNDDNDDTKG